MKKTALLLVVMLVVSALVLSSCDLINKIPGLGGDNRPCESHVDENGDYICDNCEAELERNDTPDIPCGHKDENNDHNCDICSEKLSDCAAAEGSHNCSVCGVALSECRDADIDHKCDVCGADMGEHAAAEGRHDCGYCGEKISNCADENNDFVCDVCGEEKLPDNLERVNYSLCAVEIEATSALEADYISGRFAISSGTEIRNRTKSFEGTEYIRSIRFGAKGNMITVDVPGTGKLAFIVENGSSGAATQFIKVIAPDGTVNDIEFAGTDEGSPLVKIEIDVTEGEWIIERGKNGGTQYIYDLSLSCIVEKADENGFELVSEGIVDYLCGQKLDISGIKLNSTYANGKTEPLALSDVTIDSSLVNLGASGVYPITISYKNYEPITLNINVYLPVGVGLGFDGTVQGSQTSAGNGTYVNQSFKEVYAVGETLDLTGLYVAVHGKLGDTVKTFHNVANYVVGEVDLSTAGAKQLSVSYVFGEEKVSENASLYVVDTAPSIVEDAYQVKVDRSYTGTIGAVENGYNMFTTVQQALDFLASSEASKRKIMIIEEGLYTEKLEITIPNLHIKGVGADKVTIEWDSIYGIKDAGGYAQVTDSTQTVAIRDSAYGVTIEGITISNYWNSQERMDAAGLDIERGLALLVQADRFIMRDSALLGIQDTLELFTGRQYFENVFISGYTDFIFGTNNTTLFKNCTIHVIDTVKDDQGTAGYLTAFKGSNKGAQDAITYGAVFYQCKFTADEGVGGTEDKPAKTAIGRTWGAYAAVAVIESELGGHISLDGYDSANNKNKRYISMNGIHPTDETVQFVEYGNTGAGAITEAVAGMRMLTAEEAALYTDIATIFGKTNRGVSWLDAWDPAVTEIILDDRTYYNFDQSTSEGTSHTFDITTTIASGSTLEWEGLLISAENGKVAWNSNANSLNMKAGAFIKFIVPAGSEVTVVTYPNYNYFTLNGVGTASSNMLAQYYAEETEVTLLSTGDLYIYQIIINPNEEAPQTPTLSEIKASGMKVNYTIGEELSLEGLVVKAIYSDNSVVEIADYTVDSTAIDSAAAGEYEVVFSYEGKTATVTVNYEGADADPAITENTTLDFATQEGFDAIKNNSRITFNTTNFYFNNGNSRLEGEISFMVKAGTKVIITPYNSADYVCYTIGAAGETDLDVLTGAYTFEAESDCTVVFTGLAGTKGNYIVSIKIDCPVESDASKPIAYHFDGKSTEGATNHSFTGKVEGAVGSIGDMTIDASAGKLAYNEAGYTQFNKDTKLTFPVNAGETVVVTSYPGQYKYTLNGVAAEADVSTVVIDADGNFEIIATGGAYIYSIIIYPAEKQEEKLPIAYHFDGKSTEGATNHSFTEKVEGAVGSIGDMTIDASAGKLAYNEAGYTQFNKDTKLTFPVNAGETVVVTSYPGQYKYTLNDVAAEADVSTVVIDADGNFEIIATGGAYIYSIIIYPAD